MGFYEQVIGLGVIPVFLIILICLAFVKGRRQFSDAVDKVIGVSLNINGVAVPVVPILGVINLVNAFYCLEKIQKIQSYQHKLEEEGHHHDPGYQEGQYVVKLYNNFRNLIMNCCCASLVFQMYITSYCYKSYKPLSEKAKEVEAKKKQ